MTPQTWQSINPSSPRCNSSKKKRLDRSYVLKWLAEAQARTAPQLDEDESSDQQLSLIGAAALGSELLVKVVPAGAPSSAASCVDPDSPVDQVPATSSPECSPVVSDPSPPPDLPSFTTPLNQCTGEKECSKPSSAHVRGTESGSAKRKSSAKFHRKVKPIGSMEVVTPGNGAREPLCVSIFDGDERRLAVSEEECERGSKDHCSMFSNFPPAGAEGGSGKRKSNAKIRHKSRLILPIELLTPAHEARKSVCASFFDSDRRLLAVSEEECERGGNKGQCNTMFSHVPQDDVYYAGDSSGGSGYDEPKIGSVISGGIGLLSRMMEAMADRLKETCTVKLIRKHRAKERLIDQKEREKTAKATQKMKEYEMELDKRREEAREKCQREIYNAQKEARKEKLKEQIVINKKTLKVDKVFNKLAATGKVPWGIMCI